MDQVGVSEPRALTPANENPWYVLMTLYGEQDGERVDWDLHEKNRAAWNAWSCQAMSEEERAKAAESSDVTVEELSAWPHLKADVTRRHRAEMLRRNGKDFACPDLPAVGAEADLSGIEIACWLCMGRSIFNGRFSFINAKIDDAIFDNATFLGDLKFGAVKIKRMGFFNHAKFGGEVSFDFAIFGGNASFGISNFCKNTNFTGATFEMGAEFDECTFYGDAKFNDATFNRRAGFEAVRFCEVAWFQYSTFGGDVDFRYAIFGGTSFFHKSAFGVLGSTGIICFADCQFAKQTNFNEAKFHCRYPDFSGAVLHDKTAFTDHSDYWPTGRQPNPEEARASCAAIRHNLGRQGLPEAEHFFFRREMGFAGQVGTFTQRLPYRLFGWLSDYGYSIERPTWALFWVWFLPSLILAAAAVTGQVWDDLGHLARAAGLSFANLFPAFGFQRLWFDPADLLVLNPWLKFIGAAQTVLALPLLFFLGLGLRTRFRLR